MKFNIIIALTLILISCGDANNTTPIAQRICGTLGYSDTAVKPNTIKVEIINPNDLKPLEGVFVQVDHSGQCLITDINGRVSFNNLAPGLHDIHIFSPMGYRWQSRYNINVSANSGYNYSSTLTNTTPINASLITNAVISSFVKYSGNIQSDQNNSSFDFLYFSTNKSSTIRGRANNSNIDYDIKFEHPVPDGTAINNELWVLEQATNNQTRQLVDAFLIKPNTPVVTSALLDNNAIVTDVKFTSLNSPKPKQQLIQFDSISLPVGLSFDTIYISASLMSSKIVNASYPITLYSRRFIDFTQALELFAYTSPFKLSNNEINIEISANNWSIGMNGTSWTYSRSYSAGSTNVNLKPLVETVPVFTQSVDANTILWQDTNPIPTPVASLYIAERINSRRTKWYFTLLPTQFNNTQLTLPELPAGIAPVLTKGAEYDVVLGGRLEFKEGNNFGYETYRNTGIWRR